MNVREGLCALLKSDAHFLLVGEARTGREAVKLAQTVHPDVIVMDIAMPELNGLDATRLILATKSAARILILSAHGDDEYIRRASLAGAVGFVEKQNSAETLIEAIGDVARGQTHFNSANAQRLSKLLHKARNRQGMLKANPARLTSRETEVLRLVTGGSTNKQVAVFLGIGIKTIEKHRQNVMDKLHIHDIAGLTRHAVARDAFAQ